MENQALNAQDSQHILYHLLNSLLLVRNHWRSAISIVIIFLSVTSMVKFEDIPVQEEFRFIIPYIPTFQKIFQQISPWRKSQNITYQPKDVKAEFNYVPTGDASLTDLNLTFVNLDQRIHCKLWEDIDTKALIEVIERFGDENSFTKNQIEQMKSGTKAGYHVDAVEIYQHGMKGLFR